MVLSFDITLSLAHFLRFERCHQQLPSPSSPCSGTTTFLFHSAFPLPFQVLTIHCSILLETCFCQLLFVGCCTPACILCKMKIPLVKFHFSSFVPLPKKTQRRRLRPFSPACSLLKNFPWTRCNAEEPRRNKIAKVSCYTFRPASRDVANASGRNDSSNRKDLSLDHAATRPRLMRRPL